MAEQRVTFMTDPRNLKAERHDCASEVSEVEDAIMHDKPIPVSKEQADLIDMCTRQMLKGMK